MYYDVNFLIGMSYKDGQDAFEKKYNIPKFGIYYHFPEGDLLCRNDTFGMVHIVLDKDNNESNSDKKIIKDAYFSPALMEFFS